MGRVVTEKSIQLSKQQKFILIASAACTASGLTLEEFDAGLQDIFTLLPDLKDRIIALKPQALGQLCRDPAAVAAKLLKLRELFPTANVSMLLAKRPLLLLEEHFCQVEEAHAKLHAMFPEGGIDEMVQQQPLLLVADVDSTVGELERLMPGVDVRIMLLRNPSVVLSVQRGAAALGPPADVVASLVAPY